ncbi:MAG: response regulator [Thermodesulfobacteriota bacterium]
MEGLKVLLVDDEEEFVSTLAERLRMRGIETGTAGDGEQALKSISEDPPQLVVLDVMMPGLSGLEVLRRVRSEHPHIPVILLTGIGGTREGIEGMRLGAFDYLMKPLAIEDLISRMRAALAASRGGA